MITPTFYDPVCVFLKGPKQAWGRTGAEGFEPTTTGFGNQCSGQLSYAPSVYPLKGAVDALYAFLYVLARATKNVYYAGVCPYR